MFVSIKWAWTPQVDVKRCGIGDWSIAYTPYIINNYKIFKMGIWWKAKILKVYACVMDPMKHAFAKDQT